MMISDPVGRCFFLLFLLLCVLQDLRSLSVDLRLFLLMGGAELLYYLTQLSSSPDFLWRELLSAAAVGSLLLLFSYLSRETLGSGDSLFFLLTGLCCGMRILLSVLILSFFLAALFSLSIITVGMLRGERCGQRCFPFLPFTVLPLLLCIFTPGVAS